jgi:periplasmic protein TonB
MPHSFLLISSRRWGWLTLVLVLLMDWLSAGRVQAQRSTTPLAATVGADSSSPASPPGPPINSDSALLVNQAPAFPGGETALLGFIRERLRYPSLAARNHVEGKVIVSFWLDERGRPYGFGIWKGLGAGLDEEALRILREMPDWAPAIINGRAALMQLRIPVVFRLAP